MDELVSIIHGSGGPDTWRVVEKYIVKRVPEKLWRVMGGAGLDVLDDGAYIRVDDHYIVFSSDSFTVNPIFFPGGDIGHLAASGVINDLVVMGAKPVAFMDNIVVEEGFPFSDLEKIVESMIKILREHGIALIGGDFKVMPRGMVDKIVISGFGIGVSQYEPIIDRIEPGDKIIVTGPIAEHGSAILAAQLGVLDTAPGLRSDSKPLAKTVLPVIEKYRRYITAARDPTRGGLASVLNEWVSNTPYTIIINRSNIPIREEVRGFLDSLGIDPLNVACEGVAVLAAKPDVAEEVVKTLHSLGEKHASIIGEVVESDSDVIRGRVVAITEVGGRVVVSPNPLNLPRIC
ncbi:MAG: hydrogenase expression/formation protein HypE [Thermoprotei archaeon]